MKNDEKIKTKKKPSRRKYIFATGFILLLIISALVFSLLQEPTPNSASEALIRQIVAEQFSKVPNDLKDEDFSNIRTLNLRKSNEGESKDIYNQINIADIKLIEKCVNIESLELVAMHIADKDIPMWFKKMSNYGVLDLYKRFALDLNPIKNLNHLKKLHIILTPVKDIKPLSTLTNLKVLELKYNNIYNLEPINGLTNLESLSIDGIRIIDFEQIEGLTNLKELEIHNGYILNMELIKKLNNLEKIHFNFTKLTNLKPLVVLTNLTNLCISNTSISEISFLKELNNLTYLDLKNTKVSDLEPLESLQKLQELNLEKNPISDIEPLKALKNLKMLNIQNCSNITDEQIDDLQKAFPDLKIEK